MTPEEAKKRRHRNERIAAAVLCGLAAIAVWAFVVWNKNENAKADRDRRYIPKPVTITPQVELLQQYIRIDTSNPPGNERPAAEWLAKLLAQNGVQAEIIESAPRRANLYARIRGKKSGGGLLLLHHMDVVPADAKDWARNPFSGEIVLGQVYGRGALDMKSIAICELLAFLDIAKSGRVPEHDVVFLGVADEEAGSALGVQWLLAHRPDVFDGVQYVINEGGINEMLAEQITYFGVEIGTKLHVFLTIEAPSLEQLKRVRIALEPHFVSYKAERVLPEVREFLRDLAPTRRQFGKELADVDAAIANGTFWRLPAGYRELTYNSMWCDGPQAKAGGGWEMGTRLINLPDEDPDARIRWLAQTIAPLGAKVGRIVRKDLPSPFSSSATPLFAIITDEVKAQYGCAVGTEILHKEVNDSRFLRRHGMTCYGVFPYPVDVFSTESIHNKDERLRVEWLEQGIRLIRRIVTRYAFGA